MTRNIKQIKTLIAAPAMGKTHAVIEKLSHTDDRAVIACISKVLAEQTHQDLIDKGVNATLIYSDNSKSVGSDIEQELNKHINISGTQVIVTCHAGIWFLKGKTDNYNQQIPNIYSDWDLYIDEVPSIVNFTSVPMDFGNMHYDEWTEVGTDKNSTRRKFKLCNATGFISKICKEKRSNPGLGTFKPEVYGLFNTLYQGRTITLDTAPDKRTGKPKNRLHFLEYKDAETTMNMFSSTTIMAANIHNTIDALFLNSVFKYSFVDSEILPSRSSYPSVDRITIYPLLGVNHTRTLEEKLIDGQEVYSLMKSSALKIAGNQPAIYTVNENRKAINNQGWRKDDKLVPYNAQGINSYSDVNVAISLFRYNPSSDHIVMLTELAEKLNIESDKLIEAFIVSKSLEPMFQLLTRTSIRNMECKLGIKWIVSDERAVKYLTEGYFKGANVNRDYVIDIPKATLNKQAEDRAQKDSLWRAEVGKLLAADSNISINKTLHQLKLVLCENAPSRTKCYTLLKELRPLYTQVELKLAA
ncbi:hypothetical protein RI844_04960 [Thalassotalea fonticola]|uniref:DEAD/DEAH box helicase n=1 Tax=Thalassotalea fonticola TaxID=3065649 RepID=A0ABZ0GSB0_9GAMM|nr:hypothetical protein RI844_04960 [Colwelliaceae bacterium S1-1]